MSARLLKVVFALAPARCPVGGTLVYCSGYSREEMLLISCLLYPYIFLKK
jgi:hypothetical protein